MAVNTSTQYDQITSICRDLFKKKMVDYGSAWRILRLTSLTDQIFIKAQRIRTLAIAELQRIFDEVDVIITPATASTAPPISSDALPDGESNLEVLTELMRFATMANLTGLPALSIPVGYDDKGLPIGMQFIGKAWEEAMLFRLAKVVESGVKNRKPSRWYQILNTK